MRPMQLDIPRRHESESRSTRGWWIAATILVTLLMSVPDTLFGIELGDTGFYFTFYDNFFRAPEAVEYNFMYWFSGLVGRLWLSAGEIIGCTPLLWMRFGGAAALCGIALGIRFAVVSLLGEKHAESCSLAAVVLVMGVYFRGVHVLAYDLITCLVGLWGMLLVARGLMQGKVIFVGAFLLGVNAFTRMTNLCEVMLFLLVPLGYRFMTAGKMPARETLRRTGEFFLGWFAGILSVLLLIILLGQWKEMVANLYDLVGIATGSSGSATHNLDHLMLKSMDMWGAICKRALILACFLLPGFLWRPLYAVGLAGWLLVALLRGDGGLLFATASLSLFGCTCSLLRKCWHRASILAWGGILLMRLLPMGCDGILLGVGSTALAAAVAVAATWTVSVFRHGLTALWLLALLFAGLGFAGMYRGGAYMDEGPLVEKVASVNHPELRGALTTPERAEAIAEFSTELAGLVKPGEKVLIYGGAPGLYWLSGTLPAFGNSWPEQLSVGRLQSRLDEMASNGEFPPVVFHEFDAQAYGAFTPDPTYGAGGGKPTPYHLKEKNETVERWLRSNGYCRTDSTRWFSVFRKN